MNPFVPEDFTFHAETHGIGDLITMGWLATGYRRLGVNCKFWIGKAKERAELVRGMGFRVAYSEDLAIQVTRPAEKFRLPIGHTFEHQCSKGRVPRLIAWSMTLPANPPPTKPLWAALPEDEEWAADFRSQGEKIAMIFPFSAWKIREWPLSYYLWMATNLEKHGYRTMAIGAPNNESDILKFPGAVCNATFGQIVSLIKGASVVLGNDSGPMWLTSLTNTPAYALMGGTCNMYALSDNIKEVHSTSPRAVCAKQWYTGENKCTIACESGCRSLLALEPESVLELVLNDSKPKETSDVSSSAG